MSPQFVDLTGDGREDILVGSFSGTPRVIEATPAGYLAPRPLLDKEGEAVLISAFWNDTAMEWEDSDRSGTEGHCTSVAAMDWDGDGDPDLLLGDYYGGRLYLRLNEGTATAPAFATENAAVLAGGEPIAIAGMLATPRVVDWDADGRIDVLCGGVAGEVLFYRNVGEGPEVELAEGVSLLDQVVVIESSETGEVAAAGNLPAGPGKSFHIEAVDYDGDGDLDLLVGARSTWPKAEVRVLSDEERLRLFALQKELPRIVRRLRRMDEAAEDPERLGEDEEYLAALQRMMDINEEMKALDTSPIDEGDFVWLFRRL